MQAIAMADADTTVLCTNVKPMADMNDRILAAVFPASAIHKVDITTNADIEHPRVAAWLCDPKFHTLTSVAVGARVMLTYNRDIAKGAVNGATGVVTKVEYGPYPMSCRYPGHPPQAVVGVHMKMDHSGETLRIGRTKTEYFYGTGATRFKKTTFALAPAYAMTGEPCSCVPVAGCVAAGCGPHP
jgi:hypothetical protein